MDTIVIFRCGDVRCALYRADVSEVTPLPDLSAPPSMPATLAGFLNLGGRALPVIDAARIFDVAPDADVDPLYRHVLVIRSASGADAGLLVDRVENVQQIAHDAILAVGPDQSLNGCIVGEVSLADGPAHLLDGRRILLAAEKARLEDLRVAEQSRLDQLAAS